MDQISLNKKCNDKTFLSYGFKKKKVKSEVLYFLAVPLYTYKHAPVIEAQFSIFQSQGYIGYDIVDSCSGNLYVPFYDRVYSNSRKNKVLKIVTNNLNKTLEAMNKAMIITEYKEVK